MASRTRSRSSPQSFRSVHAAWLASSTRNTALGLLGYQFSLQLGPRDRAALLRLPPATLPEPDKLRGARKDHVFDILSERKQDRHASSAPRHEEYLASLDSSDDLRGPRLQLADPDSRHCEPPIATNATT